MNTRIKCPHCNSAVASDVQVCRNCGRRINIARAYEVQLRRRTNQMILSFGAVIAVVVLLVSLRAIF